MQQEAGHSVLAKANVQRRKLFHHQTLLVDYRSPAMTF